VGGPQIAVEVANHRFARRRLRDLPHGLHGHDPRWVPRLADDPSRLDPRRDPWFDDEPGQAAFLLARVAGTSVPVGRCSAHHVEGSVDGFFGLLDTVDDPEVGTAAVAALIRWAKRLLREQGCTSMTGPASYRLDQDAGVQVAGDVDEVTGRPRTPPWLPDALEAAGLSPARDIPSWRLPAAAGPTLPSAPKLAKRLPKRIRAYADPRLLLASPDVGRVLAVPDLVGPTRAAASKWELAQIASRRAWQTAVIVELDGPPEVLVPAVLSAALAAGYASVVSPWAPDLSLAPEAVHRLYRCDLDPVPEELR
jgi:hypothetical protein